MPKAALQVWHYAGCSTCRRALAWLDARGVAYEPLPIVDRPPTTQQLARALRLAGLPLKKLFNTSGQSYRAGGWSARLAEVSDRDALAALAADGKLIKRPLLLGADFALVGFDEAAYAARFARRA